MFYQHDHQKILSKWASETDGSLFQVINGKKIHYRVKGKGPVLLLLPGTLDTLHTYDAITPYLAQHFTLVKIDIPGFGFSEPLDWKRKDFLDQINEHLHLFMVKMKIQRYHIMGNSLGGLIAWTHALKYPENVFKIILLDPAAYEMPIPWFFNLSNPIIRKFISVFFVVIPIEFIFNKIIKYNEGIISSAAVDKQYIKDQIKRIAQIFQTKINSKFYLEFLINYLEYDFSHSKYIHNLRGELILLIYGEKDSVVPIKQQLHRWQNDLPTLSIKMFENGGHLPHWENPVKLAKITKQFISNSSINY